MVGAIGPRSVEAAVADPSNEIQDVLRVRGLDVVDENGITRVKIGAPLSHAVVDGQQNQSRGGRPEDTISGILLFDAEGAERLRYSG